MLAKVQLQSWHCLDCNSQHCAFTLLHRSGMMCCSMTFDCLVWLRSAFGAAAAGFASYVSAMSKTGVLVARHGPMLANALFLPPGQPPCSAPPRLPPFLLPRLPSPPFPLLFPPCLLLSPFSLPPSLLSFLSFACSILFLEARYRTNQVYYCFRTLLLLTAWG